jgi:hypothetical protein
MERSKLANERLGVRVGITLMEVAASAAMLALLLASSAQMFGTISKHQRAADRQAIALQTVQNAMEEISNRPWDELTPANLRGVGVPDAVARYLPGAELKATVTDEAAPVSRRITVELTWLAPSGQRSGPMRLTGWAFPDG